MTAVFPVAVETDRVEALRSRVSRFADYLSAVRALSARPMRTLDSAAAMLWQTDLPAGHPGCWLADTAATEASTESRADQPWLRVVRPARPKPPDLPPVVRSLLDGPADDPRRQPALRDGWRQVAAERDADLDQDAVEPAVEEWLSRRWQPWSVAAAEVNAVRGAYSRLVELRLAAGRLEATHELVWGFGLFTGQVAGLAVEEPLLAAPVAIEVDADSGAVTVVPTGELRLQTEAFEAIPDAPDARLRDLAGPGGAVALDPWDANARAAFYRRALARFGLGPLVTAPEEPLLASPVQAHIRDTSLLVLRPRRTALPGFLTDLRAALASGHIPSGALAALLADEPSTLQLPGDQPGRWQAIGERLLFPLPANLEQESIARRLARQRLVAVQGPPGTGKTHTIANLICHLVAHGRRVLVVAHRDEPLAEVRDKLPRDLQPLAISVMGSSAKQLAQLETAVRALQSEAGALDQDAAAASVTELWAALDAAEQDLASKYTALRGVADREASTFLLDGVEASAIEVAEWLWEGAERLGFVPDVLDPTAPFPLTDVELVELVELSAAFRPDERIDAQRRLPERDALPDGARLRRADEHSDALRQRVGALASTGVDVVAVRSAGRQQIALLAEELWRVAHRARAYLPWQRRLAGQLAVSPAWRETCQAEVAGCTEMLTETARWRSVLAGRAVQIPPELRADTRQLRFDLNALRNRLVEARGVSRLLHRRLAQLRDEIRVDGAPLRTVDDVDAALATVGLEWARHRLRERWNHFATELDGPAAPDDPSAIQAIGGYLRDVDDVLEVGLQLWPGLRDRLARYLRGGAPGEADWADSNALAAAASRAAELTVVFDSDESERDGRRVRALLDEALLDSGAAPHWRELDRAWAAGEYAAWEGVLADADRLRAAVPAIRRWQQLHAVLAAAAPLWAGRLGQEGQLPDPASCQQAWTWRRADAWLRTVIGPEDTAALSRQADALHDRARELVSELTTRSAWLAAAGRLDDQARDALGGWASALRKLGKGVGRRAAGWTALAQQHMRDAVEAVPVWIMSVDRALQQFTGGTTPFDVVIVDEASQCGLLSLPVLSLGTRAVVVGDDRQIGPYAIGLPFDEVGRLAQEHLGDLPSWPLFEATTSLYDHAVRRSPEPLTLTEHFRCVPEIIAFSSEQWYDGAVQPLRADRGRFDPIRTVRVPGVREKRERVGEVNLAEADALVATLCRLVADPEYAGCTFGVVSLLAGSGQAQYITEQLVRHLGEQEMARRALKVGDSYTFQGAERDVMFISMVVSDRDEARGAFTGADHHRRVNVAASRAKDQMWVFHSVGPENLHPDDARTALLRYCSAPKLGLSALAAAESASDEALEAGCESEFERAVLRRLLRFGVRPVVQFPIGRHRIDFVIPALDGRRVAIECDSGRYRGEARWTEEMRRQSVLERVGRCVFFRVRGTLFARDPDAALSGLWPLLADLGLLPGFEPGFAGGATPVSPAGATPPVVDWPEPEPEPEPELELELELEPMPPSVEGTAVAAVAGMGIARAQLAVAEEVVLAPLANPADAFWNGAEPEQPDALYPGNEGFSAESAEAPFVPRPAVAEPTVVLPTVSVTPQKELTEEPFQEPEELLLVDHPTLPSPDALLGFGDAPTLPTADALQVSDHPAFALPGLARSGPARSAAAEGGSEPASWWDGTADESFRGAGLRASQAADPTRPLPSPSPSPSDVPPGYRDAGWIKPDEARAVLQAYRSGVDTPVQSAGKIIGWACFYPDDSIEAQRFGANVEVIRQEEASTETAGWLTAREAAAMVAAAEQRKDVRIVDPTAGETGLAEFHPPESAAAKANESLTRLLRRQSG